jgi:uncharacterized protein with HEPN domain
MWNGIRRFISPRKAGGADQDRFDKTTPLERLQRMVNNMADLQALATAGWDTFHEERHYVFGMFRVIGLMAIKLPESIKDRHPEVDWQHLCDYRERFSPNGLDVAIMQDEARDRLPQFEAQIRAVLEQEQGAAPSAG